MKNKIITSSLLIVGFLLGASALSALAAWTAPSCNPSTNPGACNTDAPINIGSASQTKAGPLVLNASSVLDDIGLTITGKIKLDDVRKGAGKVLTSDADGVGTWQASEGYEMACFAYSAGLREDSCCRMNKTTGEAVCRHSNGSYAFSAFADATGGQPFAPTTNGKYSMVMLEGLGYTRNPILCRFNGVDGSSKCRQAGSYSFDGPWTDTAANPF